VQARGREPAIGNETPRREHMNCASAASGASGNSPGCRRTPAGGRRATERRHYAPGCMQPSALTAADCDSGAAHGRWYWLRGSGLAPPRGLAGCVETASRETLPRMRLPRRLLGPGQWPRLRGMRLRRTCAGGPQCWRSRSRHYQVVITYFGAARDSPRVRISDMSMFSLTYRRCATVPCCECTGRRA